MSELSSVQSWSEIYRELRIQAETSRGTITVSRSDAPEVMFPRTTVADAFALALVFDTAIHRHGSGDLVARWTAESDLLTTESADSRELYIGNRSFWESLASAASELDLARVELPAPDVVVDAMRELATEHHNGDRARNGGDPLLITLFTEQTFKAMATRQLEFLKLLRGEQPARGHFIPGVPCTSNADVLDLARYWTDQLTRIGADACDTFQRDLYSCWREALRRVERVAQPGAPHDEYPHNFEFWMALLILCTHSDASTEWPMPWACRVRPSQGRPRNAGAVDTGATLDFPAAATWDDAARMQRDAFSKLRGEDAVAGRMIGRVPRTTIADVRQLAAYWQAGLAKVGEHSFADLSYRHVIERWRSAIADVDHTPSTVDPHAVYEHNLDFWEALMTIAIQVAVTAEAPSRWSLAKDATAHAIVDLPDRIGTALQDLASAGGRLLTNAVAKPLLYMGAGIGGLALAVYLFRSPPRPERPEHPERNERAL